MYHEKSILKKFRKVSTADIDYPLPCDRQLNENGVMKISDIISSELIKDTKIKNYFLKQITKVIKNLAKYNNFVFVPESFNGVK